MANPLKRKVESIEYLGPGIKTKRNKLDDKDKKTSALAVPVITNSLQPSQTMPSNPNQTVSRLPDPASLFEICVWLDEKSVKFSRNKEDELDLQELEFDFQKNIQLLREIFENSFFPETTLQSNNLKDHQLSTQVSTQEKYIIEMHKKDYLAYQEFLPLITTHNLIDPKYYEYYTFSKGTDPETGTPYFPFYNPKGICSGECRFFLKLLINEIPNVLSVDSKKLEDAIFKISKRFVNGGPLGAAVLQGMRTKMLNNGAQVKDELLNLELNLCYAFQYPRNLDDANFKQILSQISAIKPGYYFIPIQSERTYSHAILLVKGKDGNGYIIDLNIGPLKQPNGSSDCGLSHYLKLNLKRLNCERLNVWICSVNQIIDTQTSKV